jgi:hypothetical protein
MILPYMVLPSRFSPLSLVRICFAFRISDFGFPARPAYVVSPLFVAIHFLPLRLLRSCKIRLYPYYYPSEFARLAQISLSSFNLFNPFNLFNFACGFAALGASVVEIIPLFIKLV